MSLPPVVREALLRCTPQQRKFVMAYCGPAAGNGQLAVKMAGGKGSYDVRASMASQFLREEPVQSARDAWMTTFAIGAAELTAKIADMSRCSMEPFLEHGPGGTIKLREQTDESWARHAHWVKRVEVDPKTKRVTRLEVHDALKASEMLAKILKLYSDAPQVNLFMYLQSLSDDELLTEYERACREVGIGGPAVMGKVN